LFKELRGVDKLEDYNKRTKKEKLPYYVIIIDEFIRLTGREHKLILANLLNRLATDAKVGFRYIISIQRPTSDLTDFMGSLKANIAIRLSFWLPSTHDSLTILDEGGAEKLQRAGHGLLKYGKTTEFQGYLITTKDIEKLLDLKTLDRTNNVLEVKKLAERQRQENTAERF
jgi:S-DNA-T family DNA segregation ATPase FtsK/SpoIIIE